MSSLFSRLRISRRLGANGTPLNLADATNSTRARRKALEARIKREPGLKLLFIESVCTDPAVIASNIAVKVASGDPDYDGQDPLQAERDFRERIKHYEKSYEPLDPELDKGQTWCQMVNVGKQVRLLHFLYDLGQVLRTRAETDSFGAGHGQPNRRLFTIPHCLLPDESPPHTAIHLLYSGECEQNVTALFQIGKTCSRLSGKANPRRTYSSTASRSTTSRARLEATRRYQSRASSTCARCRLSSRKRLATSRSRCVSPCSRFSLCST